VRPVLLLQARRNRGKNRPDVTISENSSPCGVAI
jgi:hypothetical protein